MLATSNTNTGEEPPGPLVDSGVPLIATTPAIVGIALATVVAWLVAPGLASRCDSLLPAAATVRSRGTPYPSMVHVLPFIIRAGASTVLAAALIAWVAARVTLPNPSPRTARLVGLATISAVVLVTAVIYGWFGYPPNAFVTNARIHWVDIYFNRAGVWYYTLVKVHRFFYDVPYLLQALNGALNATLMYAIGRTFFRPRRVMPILMAVAYLGSSLLLLFANTAEDVQLNVAVLLCAYLFYLRRSTPWLGVALFLVVLGRPQLLLVWAAVAITEFLVCERRPGQGRLRSLLADRFLVPNLAVAAGLFAVWDGFLVVRGQNWLFHNGKVLDSRLTNLKPIATDGFTISRLGGAYVFHSLWIYPTALLVGAAVALWRVRELSPTAKRALLFAIFATGFGIAVSEVEPLFYYNVRYLAYYLPFIIAAGFVVLTLPAPHRARGRPALLGRPAVAALLCLGVLTTPWTAWGQHRQLLNNPITAAFADRGTIRAIIGDARAGTTSTHTSMQDYICYLLRRRRQSIAIVPHPRPDFHGYLFSNVAGAPPGEVVWRHGALEIVKVG